MDAEANINLYTQVQTFILEPTFYHTVSQVCICTDTQDGKTALDIAIWRGEKASVMLLMECFADMNIHYMVCIYTYYKGNKPGLLRVSFSLAVYINTVFLNTYVSVF